jgi:hypothetical protein
VAISEPSSAPELAAVRDELRLLGLPRLGEQRGQPGRVRLVPARGPQHDHFPRAAPGQLRGPRDALTTRTSRRAVPPDPVTA